MGEKSSGCTPITNKNLNANLPSHYASPPAGARLFIALLLALPPLAAGRLPAEPPALPSRRCCSTRRRACVVGWLVGWWVGGLVGWWVGCLGGWLVGWLGGWLVGWWVREPHRLYKNTPPTQTYHTQHTLSTPHPPHPATPHPP